MAKKKIKQEAAKSPVPLDQFELDGQRYRFRIASFRMGTRTVSAQDALKDGDLLEKLIRIKSGVIERVGRKGDK